MPALALCSPLAALAVPAYPGLIKQANPDGSAVEIRLHGDEFFSYATDARSQYIMEQDASGKWVVATRGGMQLTATADNIRMLREAEEADFSRASLSQPKGATLSDKDGRSIFPSTGSGNYLIVLIEYADTKFSMENPQAYYNDWFNKPNFQDGDIKISVHDYYNKVSTGKFMPNFIISPVVTLPGTSAYYVGSNGKYSLFTTAIRHALTQLNNQGFDFSRFDLDNNGVIDNIYFIYAGYGQADTGDKTTIWPHSSSFSGYYGGLQGGKYACSNELRGSHYYAKDGTKTGIGTFCHEFGHVLGLPDMYDPNYSADCDRLIPGDWSIMCNGSYLGDGCVPASYSAYDRWACRWMEYTPMRSDQEYTLQPLTTEAKAYRMMVPTSSSFSEYYIFENRTKEDIDLYIPGSGMLVWHVDWDYYVWSANRVNSTATHMRLTVQPPAGQNVSHANWPDNSAFGTLIAPGMDNQFVPFNNVTDNSWKPAVYNIKYDADSKKASFMFTEEFQSYEGTVTAHHGRKSLTETGLRIGWDALPDATGYIVNVKRRNTAGSEFYVDGYNNKLVTASEIDVNESEAMMKQEHQYTIRVSGPAMPSSKVYTSPWFKPIDADVYVPGAVEGIYTDLNNEVSVNGSDIIAPAGAHVYNMAGVETGTTGLAAGIYIVRVANQAVKVIVR